MSGDGVENVLSNIEYAVGTINWKSFKICEPQVKTEPHNMRVSFLLNISYRIYLFVW